MCSTMQTKLVWLKNNISQDRIYQLIILNFSKTNNPRIKRIIFSLFKAIFATWRNLRGKVLDRYLLSKQFWLKSFFFGIIFPFSISKYWKKLLGRMECKNHLNYLLYLSKDGFKTNTLFLLLIPHHFTIFLNHQLREIY